MTLSWDVLLWTSRGCSALWLYGRGIPSILSTKNKWQAIPWIPAKAQLSSFFHYSNCMLYLEGLAELIGWADIFDSKSFWFLHAFHMQFYFKVGWPAPANAEQTSCLSLWSVSGISLFCNNITHVWQVEFSMFHKNDNLIWFSTRKWNPGYKTRIFILFLSIWELIVRWQCWNPIIFPPNAGQHILLDQQYQQYVRPSEDGGENSRTSVAQIDLCIEAEK